ncbi:hypothetical protein AAK706_11000 [Erysipelotrichaceae bacterium 66-17]|uniref:hypothetical protein n=1 Tax=uncultured Dubosiella sp. TaxID=1937011 RepID=UPI00262B8DBC|nr:hypothetical protein [uncultured Dubosiella sp.]
MTQSSMVWKSLNADLDQYEKQVDRIIGKLEKANSLADELAEKDPDASIENLVEELSIKMAKYSEFEKAKILCPLFGSSGAMIARMILLYCTN